MKIFQSGLAACYSRTTREAAQILTFSFSILRMAIMETSSDAKDSACHAADPDLIPGSGRSPGGGHSYPLQCSCLENPMAREAWRATVHGVSKSQTRLMMSTVYIKNVGNLRDQRVQDVARSKPSTSVASFFTTKHSMTFAFSENHS